MRRDAQRSGLIALDCDLVRYPLRHPVPLDLSDQLAAQVGQHRVPRVQLLEGDLEAFGLLPDLPDHRGHRLIRSTAQLRHQLCTTRLVDGASGERRVARIVSRPRKPFRDGRSRRGNPPQASCALP